jgi:Tetratricopeptide repeat
MAGDCGPQVTALDELVQWWEDLSRQEVNSRAVLLAVPPRWGRTHLLNQFGAIVEADETLSISVPVGGASLPAGLGLQALALKGLFGDASVEHRVAEKLGTDRLGGLVQLGLGVGSLFVTPLPALVGLLVASTGAGVAQKVWDDSPAGQEGMVAKLARGVATLSVSVPVVVTIDDADWLEPALAVVLVENLIERIDGRVLVVAAVNPGGELMSALMTRSKYGLTEGRVRIVEADPDMGYQARIALTAGLCRGLPVAVVRRIGQRTQNFAEVFVATAAKRLSELDVHEDDSTAVRVVDEVIAARIDRAPPSPGAVVLAWAGGVLHARQVERAVTVLGERRSGDASDVVRFESLVRLADPASPRPAEQVRVLTTSERRQLADVVLGTAVEVGADPGVGLVEKVVAWQAAHRVRADLWGYAKLLSVQGQLVHGLEDLGDPAAAYEVAHTALAEYCDSQPGGQQRRECDDLSAAVLRLARTLNRTRNDPFIEATVAAAAAGGAVVGLEARIWAAIDLLGQPERRQRAFELIEQITAELGRTDLGAVGNRWRLTLALHAGRAGCRPIAQQLLTPVLAASGPLGDGDAARAVLYAIDGPRADTQLQIIGFEKELAALPPAADNDRLRLHHALAASYDNLGNYRLALHHSRQELPLRHHIQGADNPDTLMTRNHVAVRTGDCGDSEEALRLSQELLADQQRVLGPNHLETLITRSNVAHFTGECGDSQKAQQLFWELVKDEERVLGHSHPSVLMARANYASWIGQNGPPKKALMLFQELLMDREQVLGSDHPDTLVTRCSIAAWTGECGDSRKALRLYWEVLPEQVRCPIVPGQGIQ